MLRGVAGAVLGAGLVILAGCTQPAGKSPPETAGSPAVPPITPPPGAGMHARLGSLESVWHVRAALNVAALSCASRDQQIVQRYNRMLTRHKAKLAAAYAAETDAARQQHGATYQRALDAHMTQLYNYFAWPPAQEAFCREAMAVAQEAEGVQPGDFETFSVRALTRLDGAFTTPAVPVARQIASATSAATRVSAAPARASAAEAVKAAGPWRIQVGAFTGRAAAEAAWAQVRERSPGLASYAPHYEPVPRQPRLVRLQLGAGSDRASALRLCALASAAGFECLPVGG